jgi:CheY-like chemotaxis protein
MTGTILLVEDDESVRRLVGRVLRARGYEVLEASSGEDAQDLFTAHHGPVDLLISDIIMGGLSGPQLAERLRAVERGLPLLYMSGYPEKQALAERAEAPAAFIQKPFTPHHLLNRVEELLAPRPAAA